MLKKIPLFMALALGCGMGMARAQVVAQASVIVPDGLAAYYYKPCGGFELVAKIGATEDNPQLRIDFGIGYYGMKATKDTFRTYTIESGGGHAFIPSKYSVSRYDVYPISFGAEYKIFSRNFSPFIGLDGNFFVVSSDVYNEVPGVISSTSTGNTDWEFGILPKIGVTYHFGEEWQLYGGVGYSLGLTGTVATQQYWKTFVSIGYKFEEDED